MRLDYQWDTSLLGTAGSLAMMFVMHSAVDWNACLCQRAAQGALPCLHSDLLRYVCLPACWGQGWEGVIKWLFLSELDFSKEEGYGHTGKAT